MPEQGNASTYTSPTRSSQQIAIDLARAILAAAGAGTDPSPSASKSTAPTPVPAQPAGGAGSQSLHQEFKVVIDGIQLQPDVAASINQAIQNAVLQEIANMDTRGDFTVSRPLVQALAADSADGGGGGGGTGGVSVRFTPAAVHA